MNINTTIRIASALVLAPFCFVCDELIHQHPYFAQEYWGLFDNVVHGVIAVMVCLPLFSKISFKEVIVVYLIAALLDIDHFIINGSFSLTQAIAISVRPPTHSILFGIALASLYYVWKKNIKWTYIIFACVVSHVLRDAFGGGTLIFYPLSTKIIPRAAYMFFEYALLGISLGMHRFFQSKF
jgi:hypothetical protein